MEAKDINIRELASLAGVSIATVSRVINNPQLVQPDTREHVLEVMRRGDYVWLFFTFAAADQALWG